MRGGIYDQLGGGFHRYAVDGVWLVPHFEKMLYDQAQLVDVYLDAWLASGDPDFRRVACETADYVLAELRHADGGFFSAQDAQSEGKEGKSYCWTEKELQDPPGREAAASLVAAVFRGDGGRELPGPQRSRALAGPERPVFGCAGMEARRRGGASAAGRARSDAEGARRSGCPRRPTTRCWRRGTA